MYRSEVSTHSTTIREDVTYPLYDVNFGFEKLTMKFCDDVSKDVFAESTMKNPEFTLLMYTTHTQIRACKIRAKMF